MAKRMSKRARKNRAIRVVLIIILVLAALAVVVRQLRSEVDTQVQDRNQKTPLIATVTRGSISTTVSGSGNLAEEDVEEVLLHSGVEVEEVLVEVGDRISQGDLLARVDMSTVLAAMADVQDQLDALDEKIRDASGDEVDDVIRSALAGRIMKIYAQKGDDVSSVMYEHGALALLSLDGYLAVDIAAEGLTAGDSVTVIASDGTEFAGKVDAVTGGQVTVLISDQKSIYGDTVSVMDENGTDLGTGELYIHEMLKITGIAGTVSDVRVSENEKIKADRKLFTLKDTSFSANYTGLLEEREELEDQLRQLIRIYQEGALYADLSGTVSSVGEASQDVSTQNSYAGLVMGSATGTVSGGEEEQVVLSICPGNTMTASIYVDESSILSLELGQAASVTVEALGEETYSGTVTEIDTTASTSGGVTVYTVTVTLEKQEKMLSGMSADITIQIEGVENALLIPSDALTQTSALSYIYTGFNQETGELTGLVEVTTGMNNGDFVEILSGLQEGDQIYYFEKQDFGFQFPFGNMGSATGVTMPGGYTGNSGGR